MIDIPERFDTRMKRMEEKADDLMPGDYTIRANFFRDDEGKDVHLVAVHNVTTKNQEIEYRLHEYQDKITVDWTTKVNRQNDTE